MGQSKSSLSYMKHETIPAKAGVGMRHPHLSYFVTGEAPIDWIEIHAENYFCEGGPRLAGLEAARDHYPVSVHGVGLSLGSADGVSVEHLKKLKKLCDHIKPGLVSEHLSWSVSGGEYLNDLLPVALNKESFEVFAGNIQKTQDFLGRQILVENPSIYLGLNGNDIPEAEFLNALAQKTGCGLLLDVNNVYVTSKNTGGSSEDYFNALDFSLVQEIHIAGHSVEEFEKEKILIDTHGDRVCDDVWDMLKHVLNSTGAVPVLMEWDTNIPDFEILMGEVNKASLILQEYEVTSHVA